MAQKITKKDNYAELRTLAENAGREDLVAFVDHEVELLTKKSGKSTQTKTQKENADIKTVILEVLGRYTHPVTIAELMGTDELCGYTNQKLSALLRQLGENGSGEVVKTMDKKKAYFALV